MQLEKQNFWKFIRFVKEFPNILHPRSTKHYSLFGLLFSLFHSTMELIPLGRSDQYLYPYYKNDIDTGKIDKEFAEDRLVVGS